MSKAAEFNCECEYKDGEHCAIGGLSGTDYQCGEYNCPIKEY